MSTLVKTIIQVLYIVICIARREKLPVLVQFPARQIRIGVRTKDVLLKENWLRLQVYLVHCSLSYPLYSA